MTSRVHTIIVHASRVIRRVFMKAHKIKNENYFLKKEYILIYFLRVKCLKSEKKCHSIVAHILPPIPSNLTYEERRQRKSLYLEWSLPETETVPRGVLYVLENRNTTSVKPSWNHDTPWRTLLLVCCLSKYIVERSKISVTEEEIRCVFDDN